MSISQILITFVGAQDPFSGGTGPSRNGPILTLLGEKDFDSAYLLCSSDDESQTRAKNTASELIGRGVTPVINTLEITDPTSYEQLFKVLRPCLKNIENSHENGEFYLFISPGTPAMHSSLLLLAASDEIHANILYVRRPMYVAEDQPLVVEINPRAPDSAFPEILKYPAMRAVSPVMETITPVAAVQVPNMAGQSPTFLKALGLARRYAPYDYPVLIYGESGTGKELFAEFIRCASKRAEASFLRVNCGAFPATLLESELFGYVKGAFTGAENDKPGLFQQADGGTLFLDEVGDMPLEMQVKLLRVVQQRTVTPVGGTTEQPVDVRLILATHRNLPEEVSAGRFREDLWYRISTLQLTLPSLRERLDDLPDIVTFILEEEGRLSGEKKTISPAAVKKLSRHTWPGNIRELANVIKRALVHVEGNEIGPDEIVIDTPIGLNQNEIPLPEIQDGFKLDDYLKEFRKKLLDKTLEQYNGNQSETARRLGVSPQAISKELKKRS